ncbi:hypothetical protein [Brevundimonas sp.]|uniref:hypothetical protein n=1 Tax=Brevundimonas sp. TaxID=1871086 RepID=UPI00262C0871|nr:hypothetical protein [Brevundimonas sp.]
MTQIRTLSGPRRPAGATVPSRRLGPAWPRVMNVVSALLLLFFFLQVYENYISLVWSYLGMIYRDYRLWELALTVTQIGLVAAFLPTHLARPSAIVVWMLFAFVFLPTVALTPMLGVHDSLRYVPLLLTLTLVFVGLSVVAQWPLPRQVQGTGLFKAEVDLAFLAVWGLASLILIISFRNIMSLSSIDDIYFQRALAAEGSGGAISYVQTYYTYVLTPAVLAIGLTKMRPLYIACGLAGFLVTYMIDAQKLALVVPVVMLAIWAAYRWHRTSLALFTGGLAALTAICALLTSQTPLTHLLINVLIFRAIAVPGQVFTQYYDYFSQNGFTWWSNVRGISLIVPPPEALARDPYWPALGRIVGNDYYGHLVTGVNANANAFAGDGVAAGGIIGLFVVGIFMMIWLRALDVISGRWSLPLVTLVMLPVALCLSNVHLTTVILSFGGGFWLLVLFLARPEGVAGSRK